MHVLQLLHTLALAPDIEIIEAPLPHMQKNFILLLVDKYYCYKIEAKSAASEPA